MSSNIPLSNLENPTSEYARKYLMYGDALRHIFEACTIINEVISSEPLNELEAIASVDRMDREIAAIAGNIVLIDSLGLLKTQYVRDWLASHTICEDDIPQKGKMN